MARSDLWTREQMILVLNLYMKLPFGKMDSRNPDVKHLANIIGRTAGAVAYRLTNYASCDPILKARGISGMQNGRKQCQPYWDEFANNRERLINAVLFTPKKYHVNPQFLEWHRDCIFNKI